MAEFIGLLRDAGIQCVVDVRAHPGSRRHPQFGREALERSLARAGIRYVWEGTALGGRRHAVKGSRHTALTSAAFRAYADHMMTVEFRAGLKRLVELSLDASTAILCAERLPWECHRNLIADSLVASGNGVTHLVGPGRARAHELNDLARRDGDDLVYDAAEPVQGASRRRSDS
jgi:uncharacterized protein (DUF488 family)